MTKINARSPFYVSFSEPVQDLKTFDCGVAKGNNFSLSVAQDGEVVFSELAFGTIEKISSTAADFTNNKFDTVSVNTARTVTLRIAIPTGFANSSDAFFLCDVDAVQPLFNSGTSCTVNTTLNGSISDQTLTTAGGTSSSLNLSTKFTEGNYPILGYRVFNSTPQFISVSQVSATGGKTQSIQFTAQDNCGEAIVHIYALDQLTTFDGSGSCTAHQQAKITVNGCSSNYDCTNTNGKGGGVASDGTITLVTVNTSIPATGSVSVNADGSNPIAGGQPFTAPLGANTTGSVRNVSLYFKILIPSGYANTGNGSQYIWCQKTFVQQSQGSGTTTLPAFTYATSNHFGYQITSKGSIIQGEVQKGTIKSYAPITFDQVLTDTARTVNFTITSPNESTVYSNPNTDITEAVTITMPAYTPVCGSFTAYITGPFEGGTDPLIIMDSTKTYSATQSISMNVSFANLTLGVRTCFNGSAFRGKGFWYGVRSFSAAVGAGQGAGTTTMLYIDEYGIVQSIADWNADEGNGGVGGEK